MSVLQQVIKAGIKQHGGVRALARAVGTDPAYICKILAGSKRPSQNFLTKFGLIEVIVYRRQKP